MQVFAVMGNRFKAVPDCVAEVQQRPEAALCFVLAYNLRFDFTATGDDPREGYRIPGDEFRQAALQFCKQRSVVDDAVLDNLSQPGPVFSFRKRFERVQVAQDKPGLVKGAYKILAGLEVNSDFAADRTVHLCQERCRDLNKRDSAKVSCRNETGEISDHTAPKGDDEGLAFQALRGQLVVAECNGLEAL